MRFCSNRVLKKTEINQLNVNQLTDPVMTVRELRKTKRNVRPLSCDKNRKLITRLQRSYAHISEKMTLSSKPIADEPQFSDLDWIMNLMYERARSWY